MISGMSRRESEIMVLWCGVFLAVGVYAGFFGLIFFMFASAPPPVAIFCAVAFVVCGIGPMVSIIFFRIDDTVNYGDAPSHRHGECLGA